MSKLHCTNQNSSGFTVKPVVFIQSEFNLFIVVELGKLIRASVVHMHVYG